MRPDQKYMPNFSRHDEDDDYDKDKNDNEDINLVPFNTQLPYNVLTTGWIPVFIFDNSKNQSNISTSMSATIPNSPMGISNPFGPQFNFPNLSNIGGNNLNPQKPNYSYAPMGSPDAGNQFTTPYYTPAGTPGYNPWSNIPTDDTITPNSNLTSTPMELSDDFNTTGVTPPGGSTNNPFGGFSGSFEGTITGLGMNTPQGSTPGGLGMSTPFGNNSGGLGGTNNNPITTPLNENLTPYNLNQNNYGTPRQDIDITEIIKNFDLDLNEDLDLSRVNSDKRIDDIFSSITQKHEEVVSLLRAYNIPFPIIKLLIRKIIKLTLAHGKREDE
ncbi:hypothetical protein NNC19_00650 [Clostridium sp. SHJSY1]|uniref:hypothetical protein n=1 Tax=Clostridium sp. SHJSY1 TaxID=2942483 RepID=UPI00287532CD|nr:hypothetical protein [Clostridium sp. SHJSY1]MDS0524164.1 hypothetical protein [Clostridium sp. SHJSY1]